MSGALPPDAVALVLAYLRAQQHLGDVTVVTSRPERLDKQVPLLLIEVVGKPVASRLPWARSVRWHLGIQVWAQAESAKKIIHGVLTALLAARQVRLPDGGQIVRVDPSADPTEIPDRKVGEDLRRIVATVDVSVRG